MPWHKITQEECTNFDCSTKLSAGKLSKTRILCPTNEGQVLKVSIAMLTKMNTIRDYVTLCMYCVNSSIIEDSQSVKMHHPHVALSLVHMATLNHDS